MAPAGTLLSPEDLQQTLGTLEVLLSLFAEPDSASSSSAAVSPELLSSSAASAARDVAAFLTLPLAELQLPSSAALKARIPAALPLCLSLDPLRGQRRAREPCLLLTLDVELPLRARGTEARSTRPRMTLRQAEWMSRAVHAELCSIAALAPPPPPPREAKEGTAEEGEHDEDAASLVLAATEELSELAVPHLEAAALAFSLSAAASLAASSTPSAVPLSSSVLRTWHLFPSLSTPAKRDDLVAYASLHSHSPVASRSGSDGEAQQAQPLTGFVLAGKPGLVVLEAALPPRACDADVLRASNAIDAYWADIKSRSWRDIPSGHKKVSERLREANVARIFHAMREMTERPEVGGPEARKGTWSHRNDLGALEAWLETLGLGGRMRDVLGMGHEWTAHASA
ncbi:hypothetical protein FA09DRAFT_329018 [Tilletiopsis washingtonensis]|uniref:Uncharacterized protein n=1 Tax=Tilletiopsis washingtonensis TaxID=58919 RepID=A0A316ZDF7_9BASI|nr:hypothetical protein FA09DRAFT_329018 [Tilletiopsis washingtonensis]PWN99064.1 hypothetical protein FA09DRAFT_329018 [Tilletiopsis washingtonensis]